MERFCASNVPGTRLGRRPLLDTMGTATVSRPFDEDRLLRAAAMYQRVTECHKRRASPA
jgi:hypothetical protein